MPNLLDLIRLNKIFAPSPTPDLNTGAGTFSGQPMPSTPDLFGGSNIGVSGRMNNVFQPASMPDFSSPAPRQSGNPLDIDINSLYSPDNYFLEEYKNMLNKMPERTKPNIWRKLGAMLFEPGEEQDRFMNAPYYNQMSDWSTRMKALEPGMTAERYANTQERALAGNILTARAADRRLDIQQQEADRKTREGEERLKIQRDRAETYRFRTEHPNAEIMEDASGNVIAINPQTRKVDYLVDEMGKPIKGSTLSEQDKLNLQFKNAQALENLRTQNDLRLEGARTANDLKLIGARGEEERITKTTPADEGQVRENIQERTVTDAQGKPIYTTTTKSTQRTNPGNTAVTMHDPKTGRIYNIPRSRVAEAKRDGLKEGRPNATRK